MDSICDGYINAREALVGQGGRGWTNSPTKIVLPQKTEASLGQLAESRGQCITQHLVVGRTLAVLSPGEKNCESQSYR